MSDTANRTVSDREFPLHGWAGLVLLAVFWGLNWGLSGIRTFWTFFTMWLGFCLVLDGLVWTRDGTSLLTRSRLRYMGLFLVSAPSWWLFELLNWRVQNWHYLGRELLNTWQYVLISSINFSIVIPAVFEAAEWVRGFKFIQRIKTHWTIAPNQRTTLRIFTTGWVMMGLLLAWPRYFYPFLCLSVYFILEPINVWLGNRSLSDFTRSGDWRPIISLFLGSLMTGFFWEMWNYLSYPKWVYTVPFVGFPHIFEMPLLGYGGYLPFALENYALYHLVIGWKGLKQDNYIHLG
jgi:hypothetical protein